MSYSTRFRFNAPFFWVCGSILVFFFLWLYINLTVQKDRSRIVAELSKCLHQEVSVGNLDFIPPCAISLRNISIRRDPAISRASFFISGIRVNFSLSEMLRKKTFRITRVRVNKFKIIQLDKPKLDLRTAGGTLGGLLTGYGWVTSGDNFDLVLHDGSFLFPERRGRLFQFNVERFILKRKGRIITAYGDFGYFAAEEPARTVSYVLSGQLSDSVLDLHNFELKGRSFYAKLWGNISDGSAQLRGFSFIGRPSDHPALSNPGSSIIARAQKIASYLRAQESRIIWVSSFADWNLLDLDCRLRFVPGQVLIDRCSFSLNHIPLAVDGTVFLEESLRFQLKGAAYPPLPDVRRPVAAGEMNVSFLKTGLTGEAAFATASKKLRMDFKGFRPVILPDSRLRIYLEQARLVFTQASVDYNAVLSNLDSVITVKERSASLAFRSGLNGGSVSGLCAADFRKMPLRLKLKASVKGVDPHSLGGYLSPYSGNSGAVIKLSTHPRLSADGKVRILQGGIRGDKFFEAVADFFGVPELKEVNYQEASGDFMYRNGILYVTLNRFRSSQLDLKAAVRLRPGGFIAGKVTLGVPVALLARSGKFRRLLGLIDQGSGDLQFDFQLAGLLESPNFKWLDSDFKKRLKNTLPSFLERGVERSVDEAIAAISEK